MNILILNGSPKAEKGNSEIFIKQFTKEMEKPYEIKYIAKEDPKKLAEYVGGFKTVLIVLPLYVHASPGIVIKLFEQLKPAKIADCSIGFILQAGFEESAQQRFAERHFKMLVEKLNYTYLGTVLKGGSAGVYVMPPLMTKKLFGKINELGRIFDKTGQFDQPLIEELKKPYNFSKSQLFRYRLLTNLKITNVFWNNMLKKNNAFEKRFDKPFAD